MVKKERAQGLSSWILGALLLLATSCTTQPSSQASKANDEHDAVRTYNTIEYLVNLKAHDEDAQELYERFDASAIRDSIFSYVYQHRAKVLDMNGEPMSIEDIKQREVEDPNYSQEKLTGIRFVEDWLLEPSKGKMTKRVRQMLVGYEVVDEEGNFLGYRPGFIIDFE